MVAATVVVCVLIFDCFAEASPRPWTITTAASAAAEQPPVAKHHFQNMSNNKNNDKNELAPLVVVAVAGALNTREIDDFSKGEVGQS